MRFFIVIIVVVGSPYFFDAHEDDVLSWEPIGTTVTHTHRWFTYDCTCDNICGPLFMRQVAANDEGHGSDTYEKPCPGGKCSCVRVNVIRGQPNACNPCKHLGPNMNNVNG